MVSLAEMAEKFKRVIVSCYPQVYRVFQAKKPNSDDLVTYKVMDFLEDRTSTLR